MGYKVGLEDMSDLRQCVGALETAVVWGEFIGVSHAVYRRNNGSVSDANRGNRKKQTILIRI